MVTTLAVLMTGSCFVVAGTLVPLTRPAAPDVSICVASSPARCFELTAVLGYGGGGGRISAPPPLAGAGEGLGDAGFGGGTGVRETCEMDKTKCLKNANIFKHKLFLYINC